MSRLGTSVFSAAMARRLAKECLAALGALSIAVGIAAAALPDLVSADWRFVIALAIAAVVIGVVRAWPKRSFAVSFAHPSTTIAVKVGNLFNEEGDLVIGFSDTFDTEVGEVVSARSIQGQFLAQVYHNDRERLDRELGAALHDHSGVADPSKTKGKTRSLSTARGDGSFVVGIQRFTRRRTRPARTSIRSGLRLQSCGTW
jgi:hypothetical protein